MKYSSTAVRYALPLLVFVAPVSASDIKVKPIGRVTFNWSSGSNQDNQVEFNELDFDVIDVGAKVNFGKRFNVKVHAAVNEDDVRFKDVYLEVPVGNVRYTLGHSKVPTFFNWHRSGASKNFIERPSFRRAFGAARKFGLRASSNGDDWGWVAGVFKGDINETIGSSDWAVAARAFKGLSFGETNWFLGGSARYRGNNPEAFSYGDKPYSFALGKQFKYLGHTSDTMLAGEICFQHGALYGIAEGALLWAKSAVESGKTDTLFGGYIEVGYNLTGEETRFDFKRGSLGSTEVASPVTTGGVGLWQLSARYDVIDLSEGSVAQGNLNGGLQKTLAVGVNWQATKNVRLLTNYSRASISQVAGGNDRIDAFGMRLIFML
ncbi:MAG: porin [Kordiimonas sp.]